MIFFIVAVASGDVGVVVVVGERGHSWIFFVKRKCGRLFEQPLEQKNEEFSPNTLIT